MMSYSVLIIDEMHASIIPMLENLGLKPDYQPNIQRPEILKILPHYEGLLVRTKTRIDKELLEYAPKLKFIGRAGSGLDNMDLKEVKEKHIQVFNAPEGNRDAVAEHTLGMLLALLRKIPQGDAQIRNFKWDREAHRGTEIRGKTIGIIGYGNIGKILAQILSGFDCTILAYDKFETGFSNESVQEVSMETIFEQADIVSFHIPLTNLTRQMINTAYLQNFKKNIFLINTARGEIVHLEDLHQAILSGKVLGAGLDVLENEKLNSFTPEQKRVFDNLISLPQVVFSPHIAGWTFESYVRINEVLIEKLKGLLDTM